MYGKPGMNRKMDMMGRMTDEVELPKLTPPPDAGIEGESGTAEISWRMGDDGMVEITAINGVSLSGAPEPDMENEDEGEEMEA